jgi:autotransporter-associated beta strand protein
LVKTGAGTLTLSGANTYSGSTIVDEGTLKLSGSGTTTKSIGLTVDSGATLSGSIKFSGDVANQVVDKGTITGEVHLGSGNDSFTGTLGTHAAKVFGEAGNDSLKGGAGKDFITGGTGKDLLTGGANKDIFDFNAIKETVKGSNRDRITDFSHNQGDKIDLSGIDANTHKSGNNAFHFIGTHAFSHHEGELRYSSHVLQGDINGDGNADFEINVSLSTLKATDFIL